MLSVSPGFLGTSKRSSVFLSGCETVQIGFFKCGSASSQSLHKAKDKKHRAHGQTEIMHVYGPKSTPIAQGLVEDTNAMPVYRRSCAPIAQGLVYDINAPHAFGMRESKPNAMHAYGRTSVPIVQGLVYDINAPHTFGLRESKRTYGSV